MRCPSICNLSFSVFSLGTGFIWSFPFFFFPLWRCYHWFCALFFFLIGKLNILYIWCCFCFYDFPSLISWLSYCSGNRDKLQNGLCWDDIHQKICLVYRYVGHTQTLWHAQLNLLISNAQWTSLILTWAVQLTLLLTRVLGLVFLQSQCGWKALLKLLLVQWTNL